MAGKMVRSSARENRIHFTQKTRPVRQGSISSGRKQLTASGGHGWHSPNAVQRRLLALLVEGGGGVSDCGGGGIVRRRTDSS